MARPAPDPDAVERTLLARREDLRAQVARLTKAPERGSGISFGKRVGDGTTEAVARLSDVSVVDSLNASVEQVEHALERLAAGAYGTCEVCGQPINPARLEARPESTRCVDC
jgi:DnaK suppressor protein